ncbi:hypothetical protein N300_15275, partial [Calypte anna]
RKKFWYDSPTLGSKMMYKPSELASVKRDDQTKFRKEDNMRCRVLNGLIHKAVAEMLMTCEVNQELYDLKLEICKASAKSTAWVDLLQLHLSRSAWCAEGGSLGVLCRRRYLLSSQQILGNVPPIVFVKDKEAAAVKEIEELLSIADFGPPEEVESSQNESSKLISSATQSSDSPMRSNLFGIDHELLNKQIMECKRLKMSRDTESIVWTEEQQQQLSKIQKKIKKKNKRDPDNAITPQEYLLDRYEADYWDANSDSVSDCELEDELQEEVNELEMDDDE